MGSARSVSVNTRTCNTRRAFSFTGTPEQTQLHAWARPGAPGRAVVPVINQARGGESGCQGARSTRFLCPAQGNQQSERRAGGAWAKKNKTNKSYVTMLCFTKSAVFLSIKSRLCFSRWKYVYPQTLSNKTLPLRLNQVRTKRQQPWNQAYEWRVETGFKISLTTKNVKKEQISSVKHLRHIQICTFDSACGPVFSFCCPVTAVVGGWMWLALTKDSHWCNRKSD